MKKKMADGGDILKTLIPSLASLATSLIPGGSTFAPLVSGVASNLIGDTTIPTPLNNNNNPYGQMREGGNIIGFNQYNAPSHEGGGQTVNSDGVPTNNNPMVEIEGKENAYKYSILPDSSGSTYVFSDKNKTAKLVKDIVKNYNTGTIKSDVDFPTRTAMEFDIKNVEKKNELINQIREMTSAEAPVEEARYGKKMAYGGFGFLNNLNDFFGNNMIDPGLATDNTVLTNNTPFTGTDLTASLSGGNPAQASGGSFGKLFNKENIPGLLRTAGIAGGLVDAFQGAKKEQAILPDFSASDANMGELSADLTGAKQGATANYNLSSNLNRSASSSFGQYRNRQAGAIENYTDNLMQISQTEQGMRNNILSTKAQYNMNKAMTTRNIMDENATRNLANQARSQDFRRQGLSDLVGEADRMSLQANMKNIASAKTSEGMAILKAIAPDFQINEAFVTSLQGIANGTKDPSELSNAELILFNKLKKKTDGNI